MSDFASQVSEKDHNEVSDFVPFEVSDFAKSVSEKVLFSCLKLVVIRVDKVDATLPQGTCLGKKRD